uniref:Putative secreted protein n=1 Tax=Panstrongylus lignarius TaxID=156445 RepID=A0A224XT06_9HEMI
MVILLTFMAVFLVCTVPAAKSTTNFSFIISSPRTPSAPQFTSTIQTCRSCLLAIRCGSPVIPFKDSPAFLRRGTPGIA